MINRMPSRAVLTVRTLVLTVTCDRSDTSMQTNHKDPNKSKRVMEAMLKMTKIEHD